MKLLVILAVTLLSGAAADDDSSNSGRWTWQDSSAPQYSSPPQQYHAAVQPQYGRPRKGPIGGPAPTDAVKKATEEFKRLYKETADRTAAAHDDHVTYKPQRYDDHVTYKPQRYDDHVSYKPQRNDDHVTYEPQQNDDHVTYETQRYDDDGSYKPQPQYSSPRPTKRPVGGPAPADAVQKATKEFNRLYKEAADRAANAPDDHVSYKPQQNDDHVTYEPQRYDDHVSYKPQPQYSSPRPTKRPVGGPAPADAVQKATEKFNRLYKEAADRAANAPDDHVTYESQRYDDDGSYAPQHYHAAPQYSTPWRNKRPDGGPAPTNAVKKATEEFNRLYKEAADRAANAPDDHVTYESQRYDDDGSYAPQHYHAAPQYNTLWRNKRPDGGPAPTDAVKKATEEFNRLYKEAADRAANAPDDHVTYESQRYDDDGSYAPQHYHAAPQYSTPWRNKRPDGGPAPTDAVKKATEEFNRLYKEAADRAPNAPDDHVTYESQRYDDDGSYAPQHYHAAPQYSTPWRNKRPVGGPAPTNAVKKATEEFNRLYKEAADRAANAPDDHVTYESQRYDDDGSYAPQHYHAAPQYSTPWRNKRPDGGPAPTDAVKKATEEFNRLYKEAAARTAAAPDDDQSYQRRPDDDQSYQRRPDDDQSYQRRPDDDQSYQRRPDDDQSYTPRRQPAVYAPRKPSAPTPYRGPSKPYTGGAQTYRQSGSSETRYDDDDSTYYRQY